MVGWLEKAYARQLRWEAHAVLYEAIIAGLRAEAFKDIIANDARQKLQARLHK